MPGVGEKGRDVKLTFKGINRGLVQCKKYKKRFLVRVDNTVQDAIFLQVNLINPCSRSDLDERIESNFSEYLWKKLNHLIFFQCKIDKNNCNNNRSSILFY